MISNELKTASELINKGLLDTVCTPDMAFLNANFLYVPVFVYGPEKYGFSASADLGFGTCTGKGMTIQAHFVMKLYKGEPLVFAEPTNDAKGRISGDVFLVPPSKLSELDNRFMNTTFHRRIQLPVRWVDFNAKTNTQPKTSRCWMYLAWALEWEERKDQMIAMFPFHPNSGDRPYYTFTTMLDMPLRRKK